VSGNFGSSFTYHRDVLSVIWEALPYTLTLAFCSIVVQIGGGMALALLTARFHGKRVGNVLSIVSLMTYTLPTFCVAYVLLQVFSYRLGIFPSSHIHSVNAAGLSAVSYFSDVLHHLMLPVATLAIPGAAGIARFLRTSILTVQEEKYVTVARSMGVSERRVFYSYVLPNAVSSLVTISGLEFGALLTGSLITETIFALPGMGRLIVTAVFSRDYPLIAGCTIAASLIYICINLCTDILHRLIDPRIGTGHG
jgi:peptide/nickel transport system permease protein